MKYILIIIILAFSIHKSQSQDRLTLPPLTAIEEAIIAPSQLRAELLDRGFRLNPDRTNGEEWNLSRIYPQQQKYPIDIVSYRIINHDRPNDSLSYVSIHIRHDLIPQYLSDLQSLVRQTYETKKAIPTTIGRGPTAINEFNLQYSSSTRPFKIEINIIDKLWTIVDFK